MSIVDQLKPRMPIDNFFQGIKLNLKYYDYYQTNCLINSVGVVADRYFEFHY